MHGVGREALDEDLCLENIDVEASVMVPKNPGAFSPGPTAWESNPKRQGGMRTRCPTNPSGDLVPTQGVVVYYCRTYMKAVRGGGVKRGDVCYGMLRAAACVDESDHHALMYVWHGQIVREDRVGEASARRP